MLRNATLLLVGMTLVALVGCSGTSKPKTPPLVPVKGTASFNGKPIADGEISFTTGSEVPQPLVIKDGSFSGQAMTGKNKVEVRAFKNGPPLSTDPKGPPTKINTTPDKYNGPNSTLTADIPEGGDAAMKFDLSGK